jgi:AcrR family transcriptional regulator
MNDGYLKKGRIGQKQKTREKILRAAHEIQGRGIELTLENVAEKAGISRATIYRYYSNKDVLSAEAVLDIKTLTTEQILSKYEEEDLETTLLGIQKYYNRLAIDNERSFRKYLSVILNPDNPVSARGARRVRTLLKALELKPSRIRNEDRENLIYMATLMMGIEALIVTRDVCRLNETSAEKALQWGMKTLLAGMLSSKIHKK